MATPCGAANGTAERGSAPVEESCHGVELGHLERLVARHRRQDRRKPPGEHRLARTGWSDHEDVVSPGGRHLESPAGLPLTSDLGEIDRRPHVRALARRLGRGRPPSLAGTRPPPRATPLRRSRDRPPARPRPRSTPGRPRLAVPHRAAAIATDSTPGSRPARPGATARRRTPILPAPRGHLRGGCEHPHRDRQVEAGAFLAERPGERFTTTRRSGHSRPALSTAGRIRSRASCTPAPGSPVRVSDGSPRPTCASTATAADADDGDAVDASVHGGRP